MNEICVQSLEVCVIGGFEERLKMELTVTIFDHAPSTLPGLTHSSKTSSFAPARVQRNHQLSITIARRSYNDK